MFGTFLFVCMCVCSCIVYFCYLRFLKTKKNNLFFYFYFESNFSLISLHTQSRSALVSCYRSLSFCFLFRFVVISGFAQSLDLCFTLMHFLGAHFPQEFQQFSHIIHAFSVATATRRERLRDFHCITFFYSSLSSSLSFLLYFFLTHALRT